MQKSPVVLLPALLCNAGLFIHQVKYLEDRTEFFIPDMSLDTDIQTTAKRILDQAPPQFALGGISMGGYVAFEILRQAPERVLTLALLDTTPLPDTETTRQKRLEMIEVAQTEGIGAIIEGALLNIVAPQHKDNPLIREVLTHMAHETGIQGYINEQRVIMSRPDSRSLLANIKCPTMVCVGQQDKTSTPEIMQEMANAIPGAIYTEIANSGHLSPIEAPMAITGAFDYWLFRGKHRPTTG